ncbi:MAG: AraC family transcriptional regulator [Eubacteriales bacterium]|nr:AraC family transcriptional regulator [Eubacteriales bacterium]
MKAFHEVRSYDSDFMVWHASYENISFLAHWHAEIEFIYLRSGSARLSINDHNFTAHAGDLVVVDSGDFHYSDSSELRNRLDFLIFDPSILGGLYHPSHFAHPLMTKEMLQEWGLTGQLLSLFSNVSQELRQKSPYYQEIIRADLRAFWYRLKRFVPVENAEEQTQNRRSHMLFALQQLLAYIDEHYSEEITLGFAAQQMNFSESHFSKVFKKLIGINFSTYLNMVRIEHAAARLSGTSARITDVALTCGFNNVRSFNRTFKEITGYTPSQFMKLPEPDSYNLTYYKRKSSEQEFVEHDSVTLVKNQP